MGELVIDGPATIVIDGDAAIGASALLTLGAAGPVEIYVGGDFRMGTKSGMETPSRDPNSGSAPLPNRP